MKLFFFHKGICKKKFERATILRYGLPYDILSRGQKNRFRGKKERECGILYADAHYFSVSFSIRRFFKTMF